MRRTVRVRITDDLLIRHTPFRSLVESVSHSASVSSIASGTYTMSHSVDMMRVGRSMPPITTSLPFWKFVAVPILPHDLPDDRVILRHDLSSHVTRTESVQLARVFRIMRMRQPAYLLAIAYSFSSTHRLLPVPAGPENMTSGSRARMTSRAAPIGSYGR